MLTGSQPMRRIVRGRMVMASVSVVVRFATITRIEPTLLLSSTWHSRAGLEREHLDSLQAPGDQALLNERPCRPTSGWPRRFEDVPRHHEHAADRAGQPFAALGQLDGIAEHSELKHP